MALLSFDDFHFAIDIMSLEATVFFTHILSFFQVYAAAIMVYWSQHKLAEFVTSAQTAPKCKLTLENDFISLRMPPDTQRTTDSASAVSDCFAILF